MNSNLQRNTRINFRSLLTALCLTLTLVSFVRLDPVQAQEQRIRTLTVTGRGVEAIPTTQTFVYLGVEVQGKTAAEVQQEAAKRSSAVVELLRSRQVEKLETAGITLNPNYSYENNQQRLLIGYTATNTVSFRINTQSAGTLLDDAVSAGATRIQGVSFVATESAIAQAQKQALKKATQDAQSQADAVLNALNFKRGEILSIQVNGASAPPPVYQNFGGVRAAGDIALPTPVIGGEQQVNASVTLQISY
ncbi:MAG: SIMPL domain-containing protein [Microcoleus sp. PH2017_40_RAT_O_B]|uniref:SIMPL domain-containing protein n=1 Tax=unclassified Microcoleus TaxID=2642155 RepID=UPI001D9D4FF6|nr:MULTISPECIES: SIMPL domain-containing protein [unclassified Microcoleus]MCC3572623.1 SIMPL domain-containing protein [Microcoleus sp. PH2017_34_RAT_O_A]MCC3612147.1 SIMPL domain-containing protein [Microcoleus sp. PH2017_40_RAT_O_B]